MKYPVPSPTIPGATPKSPRPSDKNSTHSESDVEHIVQKGGVNLICFLYFQAICDDNSTDITYILSTCKAYTVNLTNPHLPVKTLYKWSY